MFRMDLRYLNISKSETEIRKINFCLALIVKRQLYRKVRAVMIFTEIIKMVITVWTSFNQHIYIDCHFMFTYITYNCFCINRFSFASLYWMRGVFIMTFITWIIFITAFEFNCYYILWCMVVCITCFSIYICYVVFLLL